MLTRGGLALLGVANVLCISSGFLLASGLAVAGRQVGAAAGTTGKAQASVVMSAEGAAGGKRVLVAGAGGRTGGIVFDKLLKKEGYGSIKGMVRTEKSAAKLTKKEGVSEENVAVADVTEPESLAAALKGVDEVVLCTSAVPKIYPFSLVKALFRKLIPFVENGRPKFYFCEKGTPEEVDWVGARALIDAAKAAGVKHLVYVGSMGGTQPENFLNTIGKNEDGTGGDILLWKRKAEEYLIASGLTYTIIHPGGLLDAEGGKRRLVLGVDDTLLDRKTRSIPRADVAQICADCLGLDAAKNRSFDVASDPESEGEITVDISALVSGFEGNTDYSKAPQPSSMN